MAQYKGSVVSGSAAIDWHDIVDTGGIAEGESGEMVVRCSADTRVAVGVTDPGTSNSAGALIPAGEAVRVILGSEAANQTVWVQSPASQDAIGVEVDAGGAPNAIAAYS